MAFNCVIVRAESCYFQSLTTCPGLKVC